ncbi:hypothetical protein LCGC14_3135750, partial [marine sediment metagenome]
YYNFLFWHYIVLKMSIREIGKKYGISKNIIRKYLKIHNIKREPFYMNKQWLYNQYIELELSPYEIGEMCRVSYGTVYNWLKIHKIPIRSHKEAQVIRRSKNIENIPYMNKKWLQYQYINLKKSPEEITKECGLKNSANIYYWLKKLKITRKKQYNNKKYLLHQYIDLKKSVNQIAGELDINQDVKSIQVIYYWLRKFNIPRRPINKALKILYWKEWDDLNTYYKHKRMRNILKEMGIFRPEYCPYCNKPKGKRKLHLMNINHQYNNISNEWFYICSYCHTKVYHYLAGLEKRNGKIKPIPNLIEDLKKLETREEREQLLKNVIKKKGLN